MKTAEVKEAFQALKEAYEGGEDNAKVNECFDTLDWIINAKPPVVIKVPEAEYNEMVKSLSWLACLEAAGVDNWVGIEEAIRIKRELDEDA